LTDPVDDGSSFDFETGGTTMARMKIQNVMAKQRRLVRQVNTLRAELNTQRMAVENSLSSLVEAAAAQSNLTSFDPLVQNNLYAPLSLNWPLLTYMYKTHGIIQAAIDMPVQDALRGGLDIRSAELGHDEIKDMQDFLEEKVFDVFAEASIWRRLYGGGAIIINTNQDPAEPLTKSGLKAIELYAADRWELQAPVAGVNNKMNFQALGFGVSEASDYFQFYGQRIHRSRVITMCGKSAPHLIRWQLQGWGLSELEKMVAPFDTSLRIDNVIYDLLKEAKIDVMRLDGFNDQLVSAAGTAGLRRRAQLVNEMKGYNSTLVMDSKDEFEQKTLTFGGLAEMTRINMTKLAGAFRIPEAKLFGQGSSGFSSGEDSIENYNCMVESEVRAKMRQPLRKILRLVSIALFGDEFDVDFDFAPLRIMSSTDEETVKTSKQNRIHQNFDKGLLTAQEAAEAMEHEKLIGADTAVARGMEPERPMAETQGELPFGGDDKKGDE
jgi:phage-related protein (TIGR01555 family)